MPDIKPILTSSSHFKQAFEEGLIHILQYKTAGTFILACANLFQHTEILHKNKPQLEGVYNHIKDHYQACRHESRQPDDADDDIAVMDSLIEIGLENLEAVEIRRVNNSGVDYLLNYNQLRSFRPARMSKVENIQLDKPFNPEGFHFDQAFLEKEIFAEGQFNGKQISLLYNKFPFIDHHALLLVDKSKHNNQKLTQEYLDYIFNLQAHSQQQCHEYVITYNSLGAGASVNHLHFHVYLEDTPLAVFSSRYIHNGGKLSYPATCLVFTSSKQAWQTIDTLHSKNTPYNLLIKDNRIYCLPRNNPTKKSDGKTLTGIDNSLFGWADMSGLLNVNNRKVLSEISTEQITSSLNSASSATSEHA